MGGVAGKRGFESLGDMVRSLGLVLVVVAVLVLITLRTKGEDVRVVDYSSTLSQARVAAPFALLDASGLPSGWRATSGYYDPPAETGVPGVVRWHIGWITPDGEYAAVEQSNGDGGALLRDQLDEPVEAGTVTVGGSTWTRYEGSNGRRALTTTRDGATVVVHGTAGWAELDQLAGALRAAPTPTPVR